MELRHLRYFLAAAQSQNFTLAANSLYITQPTLSHQIKQLEDELDMPLFVRLGRTVQLTAAGDLFKTYAKRALQELELGMGALHDLESLRRGKLTLGVLSSFGTFALPQIVADFNAAHPGIKITVLRMRSSDIEKGLLDGELNLGVAHAPADSDQVSVEPLVTAPLALLVGDRHPLACRPRIAFSELNELGLILLTPEYLSRQLVDATFAANAITPRIMIEMNAIEPILAAVRHSALATILSSAVATQHPGLHLVGLPPTGNLTVGLFTRRNSYQSSAARALADAIRQRF
jgi:LysR family cyn operon transcriptional activator